MNVLKDATFIVGKLFEAGYTAYFAGGWVRDFLRGVSTDEIDIATSAPPDKIQALFPKTIPVGIAFGVVIVVLNGKNYEVTTFRKDHLYIDGRHPTGVDFSTPEKDALRRDFTINGMFYDPLTETIHDYVGGQKDLKAKVIRAIGDPEKRFEEDRLRMMRAVRFSTRFNFEIEKNTKDAICHHSSTLLPAVSMERIWNEFVKMNTDKNFTIALRLLFELNLFQTIFPFFKGEREKVLSYLEYFPLNAPTITYLMEFFPSKEWSLLCHTLKTSRKEIKLAEFFNLGDQLFSHEEDMQKLAHFYADPHASLYLQIRGARLQGSSKAAFFETHEKNQEELAFYITHIINREPLIKSDDLKIEGILPGPKMGLLLKEAEKIAIVKHLQKKEDILKELKKSPLWKAK